MTEPLDLDMMLKDYAYAVHHAREFKILPVETVRLIRMLKRCRDAMEKAIATEQRSEAGPVADYAAGYNSALDAMADLLGDALAYQGEPDA